MNLNEHVLNRRSKCKPRTKFITAGKCEQENGGNLNKTNKSRECLSEQMGLTTKTIQNKSTLPSSSNWGSVCASVVTSSSNRRSTNCKSNETESRTIVALTEGRGQARCEVGIAVINISSPVLIISQISDSYTYINTLTKINIFNPTDILFPQTFDNFDGNRLMAKIKKKFPNIKYTAISRSLFNKINGLDILQKLCMPSLNGIVLVLQPRYYALAATSALLSYIQDNLYIYYAAGTLKVDYQESEGYSIIDVATADRLELVCSTKPSQANKHSSLFGILNNCYTKMGARMLRSWILQPLFSVTYIQTRLNCIDELMKNQEILTQLQILLQKFSNIESILNIATLVPQDAHKCSIRQLNYIINLHSIIELINPLKENISHLKQPFFVGLRKTLEDSSFEIIREALGEILAEDAHKFKDHKGIHQRCYCIKPTVNELLDVVRKIYSERVNDMTDYVRLLVDKFNLPFTLGNNQKKGYHIILHINKNDMKAFKKCDLPDEFIEIKCFGNMFTMKTPELVNMSTRVDAILEDILKISNVIVNNVIIEFKKYIPLFNKLCEEVAQLDIYQSLAQTSSANRYICPKFGRYTKVKNGQHPMLNFLMPSKSVGNSIFCSDDYNVQIITGPNGSGKSIFIRQVILLQIMAQIGSYVPAEWAIFKPAKKMCARINLDDNMEYSASSFVLEMKEIKYIMTTMTDESLIVIDELGRSTSVEEGVAIAMAILEKLSSFQSHIFITTHFTMLGKMSSIYPHMRTWQLETIPIGTNPKTLKLNYTHKLIPGSTQIGRYGVYIVRNIWLDEIIKIVDDSVERLEKQRRNAIFHPMDPKSVVKYNTESHLRMLKWNHILFVPWIKKIVIRYEENLKRLNYVVKNITFSINNSKQDFKLTDLENLNFSITNISPSFTKRNQTFNFPELSNEGRVLTDNISDCTSVNSEIIEMLHPIVKIDESCSGVFDFHQLLSNNILSPIGDDKLNGSRELSEASVSSSQFFQGTSNLSNFVQTTPQTRYDLRDLVADLSEASASQYSSLSNDNVNIIPQTRNESCELPNDLLKAVPSHQYSSSSKTIQQISDSRVSAADLSEVCSLEYFNVETIPQTKNDPRALAADLLETSNSQNIFKDYSSFSNVRTFSQKINETCKNRNESEKYVSPIIVNIIQGSNNTTQDVSSFDMNEIKNEIDLKEDSKVLEDRLTGMVYEKPSTENSGKSIKKCIDCLPSTSTPNINDNLSSNEQDETLTTGFNDVSNVDQKLCNIVKYRLKISETSSFSLNSRSSNNNSFNNTITYHNNTSSGFKMPFEFNSGGKRRKLSSPIDEDQNKPVNSTEKGEILQKSVSTVSDKTIPNFLNEEDTNLINNSSSSLNNKSLLNTDTKNSSTKSPNNEDTPSSISKSDLDSKASTSKSKNKIKRLNENKNRSNLRKKFIPPLRLTAKQIRKEFEEQDRQLMSGTLTSENIRKYVEQSINRPSLEQIQNATYLGTWKKTANGLDVWETPKAKVKKNKNVMMMKNVSNGSGGRSIDITMFSDKNAKTFEQFISSDETDFRKFHFDKQKPSTNASQRSEDIFDYYMNHNQVKTVTQSQSRSQTLSNFNTSYSLTPNGYYKQNKKDIIDVINKYVPNNDSSSGTTRFDEKTQSEKEKNLFESKNFGFEDFDF